MGIFDSFKRKSATKSAKAEKPAVKAVAKKEKNVPAAEKKSGAPKAAKRTAKPSVMAERVLIRPLLTEKSFRLQTMGQYTFAVRAQSTKQQVMEAIYEVYGVMPEQVRMIRNKPTQLYRWGRKMGQHSILKKAVVTVPKGTVLQLSE